MLHTAAQDSTNGARPTHQQRNAARGTMWCETHLEHAPPVCAAAVAILELAATATRADAALLARSSGQNDDWRVVAAWGDAWQLLPHEAISSGAPNSLNGPLALALAQAALTGSPVTRQICSPTAQPPVGGVTLAFVPLIGERGSLGVLALLHRSEAAPAAGASCSELLAIGRLCALALERPEPLDAAVGTPSAPRVVWRQSPGVVQIKPPAAQASGAPVPESCEAQDRLHREEEFLVNAAHELRTPVTSLRASAEVLLDVFSAQIPEDGRRLLVNVARDAERLSTLVDDLLDLNTIRAGRINVRPATCDLRDVAQQTARVMAVVAFRRGQTLNLVVPPTPVRATVDRALLERAVSNLVSNACKYGPEGGRIELRLEVGTREATFVVIDDGPGIPEPDRERVFQRFYRSPTAEARRVQGNGLGLPLCRAAVELLRGRVWADGAPGRGSIFRIALPL